MDNLYQVDLILIDLCKVFDTVLHHSLLLKLQLYGLKIELILYLDYILAYIKDVIVDGMASRWLPVRVSEFIDFVSMT